MTGQRGAVAVLGELDRGERHRDPRVVGVHLVGVDDPLVRHDVVVAGVVAVGRAESIVAEALPAAGPEVELGDAGLAVGGFEAAGVAPGVLGLGRGERGEHPRRRGRVGALDREGVVDDGTRSHLFSSGGSLAWVRGPAGRRLRGWCPQCLAVSARYSPRRSRRRSTARAARRSRLGRAQRGRVDGAGPGPAALLRPDQAAGLQHLNVLQDGGQRHGQRPAELADRRRACAEPLHHDPPARVGQGLEHPVQVRRLVKHALEYRGRHLDSQAVASVLACPAALQRLQDGVGQLAGVRFSARAGSPPGDEANAS